MTKLFACNSQVRECRSLFFLEKGASELASDD